MSFFRTSLNGSVTRLAIPVNVATDPRYQGQGVFSTLERENEAAAADSGSPLTVTFPNGASYPIFVKRLGWVDLPRLRLWARPLRAAAVAALRRSVDPATSGGLGPAESTARTIRGLEVRPVERFGPDMDDLGRRAGSSYGNHFVRDAEYFNWRYLDSPRDYRASLPSAKGALVGVVVVGHTFKHGVSAGFLADLVVEPAGSTALRALLARAVEEVRGGADALVLLPPPGRSERRALVASGFAPDQQEAPVHREGASRRCSPRRARRRPGTSPSATSTSFEQARLHHPAGRSASPGAGGDGAEDPCAVGSRRRGRRAGGRCRRRSPPGQLPRADGFALRTRSDAAFGSRPRSRPSSADFAVERSWLTCARSTRCSPRRS